LISFVQPGQCCLSGSQCSRSRVCQLPALFTCLYGAPMPVSILHSCIRRDCWASDWCTIGEQGRSCLGPPRQMPWPWALSAGQALSGLAPWGMRVLLLCLQCSHRVVHTKHRPVFDGALGLCDLVCSTAGAVLHGILECERVVESCQVATVIRSTSLMLSELYCSLHCPPPLSCCMLADACSRHIMANGLWQS
jgi:hypothetical protein